MAVRTALAVPDVRLHRTWAEAVAEFEGAHVAGGSLETIENLTLDEVGCARLVSRLAREGDATDLPPGRVPCSYFWLLDARSEQPVVVGFVAVRHALNDVLLEQGGHIGYSVRPSRRRVGHASDGLRLALAHARGLGLRRVLVTCDVDNLASRGVIERAGGALDDIRGAKRRYWIATDRPVTPAQAGREPARLPDCRA